MSLLDEVTRGAALPGPRCGIARLRDLLDPQDGRDLDTLLGDREVTSSALWRALVTRGHAISDQVIRRHRSGTCSCDTR